MSGFNEYSMFPRDVRTGLGVKDDTTDIAGAVTAGVKRLVKNINVSLDQPTFDATADSSTFWGCEYIIQDQSGNDLFTFVLGAYGDTGWNSGSFTALDGLQIVCPDILSEGGCALNIQYVDDRPDLP